MRLICGLLHLDGAAADPTALAAMVAALNPKRLSCRVTRRIAGVAAFATIDFGAGGDDCSAEERPPNHGIVLAADVRLDRPGALAASLGLPPGTEAEPLVLAALERWGEDLPDRLDGDFAIAAWDPVRQRLLCARDFVGVRPLCYAHVPGRLFAFASLPKGLHASGLVPARLDPVVLGRMLIEYYVRSEHTGFHGIAWLPAGHSLVLTPQGLRTVRAWAPKESAVGGWRGTREEAAATLRNLVEEAVAARLPAGGPVAAHLSGGLDSSAIAVLAARRMRAAGRRLHAFSLLARPRQGVALRDELDHVEAVLAQEPDIVWSPAHLPSLSRETVTDPDLLVTGPMVMADEPVCAAAYAAGARLLMSGGGGDEAATYNDSGLYVSLLLNGRWSVVADNLRSLARRRGRPLAKVAFDRLVRPVVPAWCGRLQRRLRGKSPAFDRMDLLRFLEPGLAREVAAVLVPSPDDRNRPVDRIWRLTASELLGRITRWATLGAGNGIAFTFPLLDRRVVDFCLALPLEHLLDRGWPRQPFRNAMDGVLPERIRWRETKFLSFPDMALEIASAKPALLAEIDGLRDCRAVTELFNLDALATAMGKAPDEVEARRIAETLNGPHPTPPGVRWAMDALRALTLARLVARLGATA